MFYKKNYRRLKNENITIRDILGKEKTKLISKGIEDFKNNDISYTIKPLEQGDINNFLEIYRPFIQNKENPKDINIQENIEKGQDNGKKYFICGIEKNNIKIGMGIFVLQENVGLFTLGYRAYIDEKINKIGIGYYIEYLFFNEGLKLNINNFSRGIDRNGYGYTGAKIGLALHKLELKFMPHAKKEEIFIIDEKDINKESIFFSDPDKNGKYTKAMIYTNKSEEEIEKYFGIIKKRGLILEIKKIN